MAKVFLMAQGPGSRWGHPLFRVREFDKLAPPYKQLLAVNGEPLISRSVRLFREVGWNTTVVANEELIRLAGLDEGITLKDPGNDILDAVLQLPYGEEPTIIALGDVLFSRDAVNRVTLECLMTASGVMARCEPSRVCRKVADEVFALWFHPRSAPYVLERCRWMRRRGSTDRPKKPWGFPFAGLPDLEKTTEAYKTGAGLKTVEDDLLVINDYTDDVDSPEEWEQFWPALRSAAENDL